MATANAQQSAQHSNTSEEEPRPEVYNMIKRLLDVAGVDEYDSQVVDMMIDFVFSYTTDVLQDAKSFGEAAGQPQGTVNLQDVELAIQARMDLSFARSPSLEALFALSESLNSRALPDIQAAPGLPLPGSHTLLAANAQYEREAADAYLKAAAESPEMKVPPSSMSVPQAALTTPVLQTPAIPQPDSVQSTIPSGTAVVDNHTAPVGKDSHVVGASGSADITQSTHETQPNKATVVGETADNTTPVAKVEEQPCGGRHVEESEFTVDEDMDDLQLVPPP